jgi:hypothetical protein
MDKAKAKQCSEGDKKKSDSTKVSSTVSKRWLTEWIEPLPQEPTNLSNEEYNYE